MPAVFRSPYFRITASLLAVLVVTLLVVERPVKHEHRIEDRVAEGKKPTAQQLVPVWLWRGLVANVGLATLLVSLSPWASRPIPQSKEVQSSPALSRRDRFLVGAALVLLVSSNAPRLGQSLWGDEEYVMKTHIAPAVTIQPDGEVTFTPRSWSSTIWGYQRPTNHIGQTVLSRLFHAAFFRPGDGPRDPWFSEFWVRMPSFLAGLGSVLTLVWCCQVWWLRRGLGWIALGYAGHAWLVRFGVDARAYGLVIFLAPLLLGIMGRALQTGHWRWWIGFALVQFYLMWSYLGAIHVLIALNFMAIAFIFNSVRENKMAHFSRWFAACLLNTMLVVGLMAPCFVQFFYYLKEKKGLLAGAIDLAWFKDTAAAVYSGALWNSWDSSNPFEKVLSEGLLPIPLVITFMVFGAVAMLLGSGRLALDRDRRPLLIFLWGGPLIMILHLILDETRPYQWYLTPFLPNLFILWAAAWPHHVPLRLRSRVVMGILGLALIGVHVLAFPTARLLSLHPIEACRESVAVTREITNPRHPEYGSDAITASPGMTTEAYDPAVIRFSTVNELVALIDQSKRENRPLFLNFGFRKLLEKAYPEVFTIIDDPAIFELIEIFPGQFFTATREVRRLR